VYKATLARTGETVAVKVQRPGIGQSIAIDMLLLRQLLQFFDNSQDLIAQELTPLVDEFASRLFGELDYVQEGKNCERFTALYKDVPRITTPSIQCVSFSSMEYFLWRYLVSCTAFSNLRGKS
jgi:aarF domain-containing kinase